MVSIPLGFRVATPRLASVVIVVMLLLATTFVGFGIALASMFRDCQGFSLLIQFIVFPLLFLSWALFPIAGLPGPVRYLALLNPLPYGVDPLRAPSSACHATRWHSISGPSSGRPAAWSHSGPFFERVIAV